ncbi:MAG: FAD-binding oxidoreductase, partial [Pseudomonadota bacterium]
MLEGTTTADWLVIGAGFAGLAAARRLSLTRSEDRIILLDASRVGEGPAGRNSGFMIDLPHDLTSESYAGNQAGDRAQIRANRAAIAFALETAQAFDLPEEAIRRTGKINGAASKRGLAQNKKYARHLSRLGEDFALYDAETMRDVTGSRYYLGGLFTPGTAMLQPAMFTRGIAAGLRSNRLQIFENSPVTELSREGGTWRATTPHGRVTAPRVILAVNGHAESFGLYRRRLVHVMLYASMTRPLTADEGKRLGGRKTWGITPADPMGSTVRRIGGTGG